MLHVKIGVFFCQMPFKLKLNVFYLKTANIPGVFITVSNSES